MLTNIRAIEHSNSLLIILIYILTIVNQSKIFRCVQFPF